MSSRSPVIPYFPGPPKDYDARYMSQVMQSFALFAQQIQTPGPVRATTLKLTNLPVFADNAAALTGNLSEGDVYRTATGELRIVV